MKKIGRSYSKQIPANNKPTYLKTEKLKKTPTAVYKKYVKSQFRTYV